MMMNNQEQVATNQDQVSKKPSQVTLQSSIARTAPFTKDGIRHSQLEKATADFICQSLQPVSIVHQPSFRRLLEIAEPHYQLAHHTYFTDTVIPKRYREVRSELEKLLSPVQNCTILISVICGQLSIKTALIYHSRSIL